MNIFTKALNKLFKSGNQQELNKIKPIIGKINDLEKNFLMLMMQAMMLMLLQHHSLN